MNLTIAHLLFAALPIVSLQAQIIVNYDFEGRPAVLQDNVVATDFAPSEGSFAWTSGNQPTPATAISATGWAVADGVKAWQFTVTADPNSSLVLSSLRFDDRASVNGPLNWSLTVNGIVAASSEVTHGDFSPHPMNTIDLSGPNFQGLESAEFKIFGSGAADNLGAWRLDNVELHGIIVSVTPIPEPHEYALLAGLALLGFALSRRRFFLSRAPSCE